MLSAEGAFMISGLTLLSVGLTIAVGPGFLIGAGIFLCLFGL